METEWEYGIAEISEVEGMLGDYDIEVSSVDGWVPIKEFLKTGKKLCYRITTKTGLVLECADSHLIEIFSPKDDKEPVFILTKDIFVGLSVRVTSDFYDTIVKVEGIGVQDTVDISVGSEYQRYYAGGISSHNSPGSGKTTTARIFAKAIACDHEDKEARPCGECDSCRKFAANSYPDYIEVDGASYNKVEDVKVLVDIAKTYPVYANKSRIILIDEAHRLSNAAWDTMLKLLEDGVTKTIFLFATTELDKIRAAIQSRSIVFQVKPLSVQEISRELVRICKKDNISYDMKSIEAIAYANRGKTRDAIKTLDMYNRAFGEIKNLKIKTDEESILEMIQHSYFNQIEKAYDILDSLVNSNNKFGGMICSTLSALYIYPKQITTGIPESVLNSAKTIMQKDIKRFIELYCEYKPDKYEEVKLFLSIIAELGIKVGGENTEVAKKAEVRRLFKKPQEPDPIKEEDEFELIE